MTKRWTSLSAEEIAAKSAANRASRTRQKAAPARPNGWDDYLLLVLPYAPTVNHYWLPNKNHSKRISDKGLKFRALVAYACAGLVGVKGRVSVDIVARPPDRRKRDLDNLFKALLDALSHAGMIEDDSLIDRLSIARGEVIDGGALIVTIRAI